MNKAELENKGDNIYRVDTLRSTWKKKNIEY